MFKQANELSNRNNSSNSSSNSSSNVVITLSSSNEVVISSVVGVIRAALILNLNRADDGLSNGGVTTS